MVELISSVADLGKGPRGPLTLLSSRSGSVTDHAVTDHAVTDHTVTAHICCSATKFRRNESYLDQEVRRENTLLQIHIN